MADKKPHDPTKIGRVTKTYVGERISWLCLQVCCSGSESVYSFATVHDSVSLRLEFLFILMYMV